MKYNILAIADLHWGAMDAKVQASQYEFIFDFLKMFHPITGEKIDLLIIVGDYWDSRVILNSNTAIDGVNWMEQLWTIAVNSGVCKIRVIRGTKEHDNDQLEVFRFLDDGDYFHIFTQNTYEETLPGLRAIYCPEENISHEEYIKKYQENIVKFPNIGFFHGNMDSIMPIIAQEMAKNTNTLIYNSSYWHSIIPGPMIAGHWHNAQDSGRWHYIGTPDHWEFGLTEEPGIGFISFDTDDNSYFYRRIINPIGSKYEDFYLDTSFFYNLEDYQNFICHINKTIEKLKSSGLRWKVRINILITDEKEENDRLIPFLKSTYENMKNIKITIKDKLQKKRKKEEKEKHEKMKESYSYTRNQNISMSEKIRQHILSKHDKENISLEDIKNVIVPYLPDGKDG